MSLGEFGGGPIDELADLQREIDRLRALNTELLAALYGLGEQVVASHNGWCFDSCADNGIIEGHSPRCAAPRAAIAKAEGR